jgi:hypothetical protein
MYRTAPPRQGDASRGRPIGVVGAFLVALTIVLVPSLASAGERDRVGRGILAEYDVWYLGLEVSASGSIPGSRGGYFLDALPPGSMTHFRSSVRTSGDAAAVRVRWRLRCWSASGERVVDRGRHLRVPGNSRWRRTLRPPDTAARCRYSTYVLGQEELDGSVRLRMYYLYPGDS